MVDQRKEGYFIENRRFGQKQIEASYEDLEKKKREHWDKITDLYKNTQSSENIRNIQNETAHKERLAILEKFDQELPGEMKEVDTKIKTLMEIEQSDKLQEAFDKFKAHCNEIMQKKNNLILEFSKQHTFKNQLYVESMKNFRKDIDTMINLMRTQFLSLRENMLEHLDRIEAQFLEDRKDIIEKQYMVYIKDLIEHLESVATKKENELTHLQDTQEALAEEAARKAEAIFINKVIMMENHLNFIKEKIEDFTYDIKILSEKLEYRVKVREEKIKEAEEKKSQFHEWNQKLTEKINFCNETYKKNDLQKRIKNAMLKNELIKMTESFDELKKKFQHFEKYDELRFKQIFQMKSKDAKELALKVALADRTIKTQQLGLDILVNDNPKGFSLEDLQKEQELEEENNEEIKENEEDKNYRQNVLARIPTERVKQVFGYIIQEAEFLIQTKLIEECAGMSFDEKLPAYLESICQALNIKNEQELNQLLALFDKYNVSEGEEVKASREESNEKSFEEGVSDSGAMSEKNNGKGAGFEIDPDMVLIILKEFYEEKKKRTKEQMIGKATSNAFSIEDNEEAKKERMKYLSEIYWDKLGNIISEKTYNVWMALDTSLNKYHTLLFERKDLVEEVKSLSEKNVELKKLLSQYMESEDNKALKIPPHQTIRRENINSALVKILLSLQMGQMQSKEKFAFTKQELRILFANFKELDSNDSGFLEPEELFDVEELRNNPIVQRVISVFDANHDGLISFYEFIAGLTALADGSGSEEKFKFAFQVYDVNGDGKISNGDLFFTIKLLAGDGLSDVHIQQVVDRTLLDADKDQDGVISYEEFVNYVQNAKIEEMFSMPIIDNS